MRLENDNMQKNLAMIPLSVHLEGVVCPEDLLAVRNRAPVGEGVGEVDRLHMIPDKGLGLDVGAQRTWVGAGPRPG